MTPRYKPHPFLTLKMTHNFSPSRRAVCSTGAFIAKKYLTLVQVPRILYTPCAGLCSGSSSPFGSRLQVRPLISWPPPHLSAPEGREELSMALDIAEKVWIPREHRLLDIDLDTHKL